MDIPVLADQQGLRYISSVRTQDAVQKTCKERWMISMDGERESENSVLSVSLDDDDDTHINVYTYI